MIVALKDTKAKKIMWGSCNHVIIEEMPVKESRAVKVWIEKMQKTKGGFVRLRYRELMRRLKAK